MLCLSTVVLWWVYSVDSVKKDAISTIYKE